MPLIENFVSQLKMFGSGKLIRDEAELPDGGGGSVDWSGVTLPLTQLMKLVRWFGVTDSRSLERIPISRCLR